MENIELGNKSKNRHRKKGKKEIPRLQMPEIKPLEIPESSTIDELDEEFKAIEEKFLNLHIQKAQDTEEEHPTIEETEEEIEISKQKVKKYGRPTIGMLKSISRRPELIEPFDTDAQDPFTLAEIKNLRNVVGVPNHWNQKRRYLNYKRGTDVSRYRLPIELEKTGIPQMRQALLESDDRKSLATKQRDRARPKLGMFDLSPALLQDAFFKLQTKPVMTRFGDIYFEGKELEPDSKRFRPGHMSDKLRAALGMVDNAPPPWLHKMQKIGPPPSYPNLKLPGLNAPLPYGCDWGLGANGWGQVPVNEQGLPSWGGNPFGKSSEQQIEEKQLLWGTLHRDDDIGNGVNF